MDSRKRYLWTSEIKRDPNPTNFFLILDDFWSVPDGIRRLTFFEKTEAITSV